MFKKIKLNLICLLISSVVLAQGKAHDPTASDIQVLSQQGDLVSVKVVVGEPVKIFVLGREEVHLDFSNLKINAEYDSSGLSLQVKKIKPSSKKILTLVKHTDHISVKDSEKNEKPYELEVTTKVNNKLEQFKFKIDNRLK